ncbi:MAG: hypothetical protein RLZZ50_1821 [Verrucomicrobiota bacterium]
MPLTTAAQTDIGLVRSENEDRLLCADDLRLYAVADGIGGLPGGGEAAQLAVTTLLRQARRAAERDELLDLPQAFQLANHEVIQLGQRFAPDIGMGTTLTVAHVLGDVLRVASVGDSRCYLFRGNSLSLLTTDDTIEQEVIVRRARGEDVQLEDRHRNALTRCIGQPMPLEVQVSQFPLQTGDRVLVCSDGITRMLDESAIARRLGQTGETTIVLGALIADALAKGGADNATGVLIDIVAD